MERCRESESVSAKGVCYLYTHVGYKLWPKQTEAVVALFEGMIYPFHLLKICVVLKINLVGPTVAIAVTCKQVVENLSVTFCLP